MILIVDMSSNPLSRYEFVDPIRRIVEGSGLSAHVVHYSKIDATSVIKYDKIILCGTALADNDFLTHNFSWLKTTKKQIFGICAGMEAIAKAFGGKVTDSKEIGMAEIISSDELIGKGKVSVYALHGKGVELPQGFTETANNKNCVQAMEKDKIYCIQFHPEVRNEKILRRWLVSGHV